MFTLIKILKIFLFPIVVFLISIFLLLFDFYSLYAWIDIPMHLLGGFSIAISFFLMIRILQKESFLGKMHPLILFVFIISLVSMAAVLWEFAEFIFDNVFYLSIQRSLEDTLGDLFFGLLGGVVGFLWSYPKALR